MSQSTESLSDDPIRLRAAVTVLEAELRAARRRIHALNEDLTRFEYTVPRLVAVIRARQKFSLYDAAELSNIVWLNDMADGLAEQLHEAYETAFYGPGERRHED